MKRNSTTVLIGLLSIVSVTAFAAEQAPNSPGPTTSSTTTSAPRKLDLRAPDITQLYSAAQLRTMLGRMERGVEEIEVRGRRPDDPAYPETPAVWSGIAAPIWALLNPTQAWRIFAPLPPDQALRYARPDDVTTSFQPVSLSSNQQAGLPTR